MRGMSLTFRSVILLSISVLAILAILLGIVVPSIRRITTLQKEITDTQVQFEKQYREATLVRRSMREAPQIAESLQPYEQATISATDALDMITLFENLADEYNIVQTVDPTCTLEAPKPVKGKKNDPVGLPSCTFTFVNHGTLTNQLSYLAALERLPQYLYIDTMSWQKRNGTGANDVTVQFGARIYIR